LHEVNFSSSREAFRSLARERISTDAHKVHVLINPRTGENARLTEPLILNQETALLLKNDSDAFAQFLRHHASMVTKFFFVLYLTRLDPRAKAFPMAILPTVHGHATDGTLSSLAVRLLDDSGRSWSRSKDLVFGLTGGLNGWKRLAIQKDFT
jgi:hypothetical protein